MIVFQVSAISFSEKGDYFVTVGVRIVKFWYIGSTDNANKVRTTEPKCQFMCLIFLQQSESEN